MRLLLTPSLVLTLLFAALVGLIRAQPYDDAELRAFLTPPDGCPMPCFIGIRPGVTTVDEAVRILEAHEWVSHTATSLDSGSRQVTRVFWFWSERSSAPVVKMIDGHLLEGQLEISDGIVQNINIVSTITAGEFWLLWGIPDEFTLYTTASCCGINSYFLISEYGFSKQQVWTISSAECPFYPTYWHSQTTLIIGDERQYISSYHERSFLPSTLLDYAINLKHRFC